MDLKTYQSILIERIKEQQAALPEPPLEDEATIADYQAVLKELGVDIDVEE